jgi:hypothetical protein
VTACLEADGIDGIVDLRHFEDLLDLLLGHAAGQIHGLATDAPGLGEAVFIEVADDHDGRAE